MSAKRVRRSDEEMGHPVTARLVNRVRCTHPECAELRRMRRLAFDAKRYDLVNTAERELGRCEGNQS